MPLTLFLAPTAVAARRAAWEWIASTAADALEPPLIFARARVAVAWRDLARQSGPFSPRLVGAESYFARYHALNARSRAVGGRDRVWILSEISRALAPEFSHLARTLDAREGVAALGALWAEMQRAQSLTLPPGDWQDEAAQVFARYREKLTALNAFDSEAAPALFPASAAANAAFGWPRALIVDQLLDPSPALQRGLRALVERAENVAVTLAAPGQTRAAALNHALEFWRAQGARIVEVEFEPGVPVGRAAARFLGADIETPAPNVGLTAAHTRWDEATRVAAAIRRQLDGGAHPEAISLAVADIGHYAPLLRAAFEAHGVPLRLPFERPLLASPLVRRLLCALENARGHFDADDLVDLFGDDTLRLEDEWGRLDAPRLRAAARAVRCADLSDLDALRAAWRARLDERDDPKLAAALGSADLDLVAQFNRLVAPQKRMLDGAQWCEWLDSCVERLAGHWCDREGDAGETARAQLRELHQAARCVAERAAHWRGDEDSRHGAREWLSWLYLECESPAQSAPNERAAVRAFDLNRGDIGFSGGDSEIGEGIVYVLGLNEGQWPAPRARGPIAARDRELSLELQNWRAAPIARASYLLARAMGECAELWLSHPQLCDGAPVAASPLLEDLRALWPNENWRNLPRLEQIAPTSRAQWLAQLGAQTSARMDAASLAMPLQVLRQMQTARANADAMGVYDGVLGERGRVLMTQWRALHPDAAHSASSLELYARCPLHFFLRRVLAVPSENALEDDLSAAEAGDLVHRILHEFQAAHAAALTPENFEAALIQLETVASSACRRLSLRPILRLAEWHRLLGTPDEPGPLRRTLRAQCEAAADGGAWARATRPALHGTHAIEGLGSGLEEAFAMEVGGESVRGVVDRLDLSENGDLALVVDYKTGAAARLPALKNGDDGLHFQLALYGMWARQLFGDWPLPPRLGLGFLLTKTGAFTAGIGQSGALSYKTKADGTPGKATRQARAIELNDAQFERWLDGVSANIARIGELMRAGTFHLSLQEVSKAGCEFCGYASVCERQDSTQTERAARAQGENGVYLPMAWSPSQE